MAKRKVERTFPPHVMKEMPQRMLNAAVAFYQAGIRCGFVWEVAPDHTIGLGAPTVVNFAFSLELYLKLLILLNTQTPAHGHTLLELYDELDADTKLSMQKHCPYPGDDKWVREMIEDVSNNFVDWRYAHEKEFLVTSTDTLRDLGRCLHKTVSEIKPDLISDFERRRQ